MKRILIVNVNWLGDTLFVTPFIRTIRENYPDSYIAVVTHPRCRQVLEDNPHIDEIIIYDEKVLHRSLLKKISIISQLRSKRFDIAFILRRSLTRTMLIFLSKIPERIGHDNKKSGFLLTRKVSPPPKDIHRVEYFLTLARSMGMQPRKTGCEFFVSQKDKDKADEILKAQGFKGGKDFVVINPGGNWELKRWPAENFAKLGDAVFDRFNMAVVLTGAEKDMDLCKRVSHLMDHEPILLCGKTDLKTLGAIFKKAKWVISSDSGPMHIAAALKTSLVALFGPTAPKITGPHGEGVYKILCKDVDCEIPCYNLSCKDNRCMKAISVKDVLEVMS
ncbi:lipopolysaccharide heptosyltransferase II [Candidatus Omnitrophota bacterium]